MKQKKTFKDLLFGHKITCALIGFFIVTLLMSNVTQAIPEIKMNNAIENKNQLNNEINEATTKNDELSNELNKESKTNSKLNRSITLEETTNFQVNVGSKWKGTYTISDRSKRTYSLLLEINEHNAIFNFEALDDGTKGSYYMGKNTIDPTTGFIELVATEWKDDPSGYYMVDLSGVAKGNRIKGIIIDSNNKIGTFSVSKVD